MIITKNTDIFFLNSIDRSVTITERNVFSVRKKLKFFHNIHN